MKPHLVLLVDGDQTDPEAIPTLLKELEQEWTVTGRVCVRNWRAGSVSDWAEVATRHGLDCVHHEKVRATKNGADIELVIRAVDLIHAGHTNFCIVSRDSDFLPLRRRVLRSGGLFLWRDPATGEDYEAREPAAVVAHEPAPNSEPDAVQPAQDAAWEALVRRAYQSCVEGGAADEANFVPLTIIGQAQSMKGWRQKFKVGASVQLRQHLDRLDCFEVKEKSKGAYVVRLQPQK